MKKALSLLAGMVFVFAVGTAYADDVMPWDSDDKIFREEDLLKYNQNQGTVNQMPAKPGEGGSAAGGSGESDSIWKGDTYEKPAPVEKNTIDPYDEIGRGMDDPYKVLEEKNQDIYRY
jgi:hypothetical protein